MLSLSLLSPDRKSRLRRRSVGAACLLVYFLLFSVFALFHAYAANELVDSHGCAIGLWVQHGQALLSFLAALALFLIHLAGNPPPRIFFPVKHLSHQRATRAPPYQASLC